MQKFMYFTAFLLQGIDTLLCYYIPIIINIKFLKTACKPMLDMSNQITFIEPLSTASVQSKNEFLPSNDKILGDEKFMDISTIQKKSNIHLHPNTFQRCDKCDNFTQTYFQNPTILLNNILNLDQQKNQKIFSEYHIMEQFNPDNNEKTKQKIQTLLFQVGLLRKQNQLLKRKLKQLVQYQNQSLIILREQVGKLYMMQQKQALKTQQKNIQIREQNKKIRIVAQEYISQILNLQKSLANHKQDESLLLQKIKQQKEKSLKQMIQLKQELLYQTKLNKCLQYQIFELKEKVKQYQHRKYSSKFISTNTINANSPQHSQNANDNISIYKKQLLNWEINPQKLSIDISICPAYSSSRVVQECSTQSCKQIPKNCTIEKNKYGSFQKISSGKQTEKKIRHNTFSHSKLQDQLTNIKTKIKLAKQQVLFTQR